MHDADDLKFIFYVNLTLSPHWSAISQSGNRNWFADALRVLLWTWFSYPRPRRSTAAPILRSLCHDEGMCVCVCLCVYLITIKRKLLIGMTWKLSKPVAFGFKKSRVTWANYYLLKWV